MIIDVSKWNGVIDWERVKKAGVRGAIIRVGVTGYGKEKEKRADSRFAEYYAGAKAVGLEVGGYWYSCAYDENEAREEAQTMLEIIKGKQFELPLYWDTEDNHDTTLYASLNQKEIGKDKLTKCAVAFCEEMERAGYFVGIYASKSWFENQLDMTKLKPYAKWIAHYTTGKDYSSYGMWQYTSSGTVDGINGAVDLNKKYVDYGSIIKVKGLNGFGKKDPREVIEQIKKLVADV